MIVDRQAERFLRRHLEFDDGETVHTEVVA
jgi:hypothetical protein